MNDIFDRAVGQTGQEKERADFDLAHQLFNRLRFGAPETVFDVTRQLVVPHMKPLDAEARINRVLTALDPTTDNIKTKQDELNLWSDEPVPPRTLRELVYPKPEVFSETGTESNRQLARILNEFSRIRDDLIDPVERLKRPVTGDKVLYLPQDPDKAAEEQALERLKEQGVLFKQQVVPIFKQELLEFLYADKQMMSDRLKFALYRMPEILEGGANVRNDISALATNFYELGYMVRKAGNSLSEASRIVARPQVNPGLKTPAPPEA